MLQLHQWHVCEKLGICILFIEAHGYISIKKRVLEANRILANNSILHGQDATYICVWVSIIYICLASLSYGTTKSLIVCVFIFNSRTWKWWNHYLNTDYSWEICTMEIPQNDQLIINSSVLFNVVFGWLWQYFGMDFACLRLIRSMF